MKNIFDVDKIVNWDVVEEHLDEVSEILDRMEER